MAACFAELCVHVFFFHPPLDHGVTHGADKRAAWFFDAAFLDCTYVHAPFKAKEPGSKRGGRRVSTAAAEQQRLASGGEPSAMQHGVSDRDAEDFFAMGGDCRGFPCPGGSGGGGGASVPVRPVVGRAQGGGGGNGTKRCKPGRECASSSSSAVPPCDLKLFHKAKGSAGRLSGPGVICPRGLILSTLAPRPLPPLFFKNIPPLFGTRFCLVEPPPRKRYVSGTLCCEVPEEMQREREIYYGGASGCAAATPPRATLFIYIIVYVLSAARVARGFSRQDGPKRWSGEGTARARSRRCATRPRSFRTQSEAAVCGGGGG